MTAGDKGRSTIELLASHSEALPSPKPPRDKTLLSVGRYSQHLPVITVCIVPVGPPI